MTQSADLKKLLQDIFQDGIVEVKEREALHSATDNMPAEETAEVFKSFLGDKWGEAIADDVITSAEQRLLCRIMVELHLELSDLPHRASLALKDVF